MTRATLTLTAALITACAAPTTREVCGTLPDGSEFCTIVTTRSLQ